MSTVRGARVVVTGAGGGIGAALAGRFAAGGARVVVNDLDAVKAHAVAESVGGIAVPGEASAVVEQARDALGGAVDIYCANAGYGAAGDPFADEEIWASAWDVNVMAHVRASRILLPDWLERGEGRFVSTVSAAGLLTMIGAAPYSVTKHGALAYAEWLSLTYSHRGIKVHAICPQGVRTDMLTAPDRRANSSWPPRRSSPGTSRTRCSTRWTRTGSWCSRTPRWPTTTGPAPATPTAGWRHEPDSAEMGRYRPVREVLTEPPGATSGKILGRERRSRHERAADTTASDTAQD